MNFSFIFVHIMRPKYSTLILSFAGVLTLTSLLGCKKNLDDDVCVTGLSQYKGKRVYVGCITRSEFIEYLKNPTERDPSNNQLIDKELMIKEVTDCSECN